MKNPVVFFSFKLVLYVILFGFIPSIFIIRTKIISVPPKKFLITSSLALLFIVVMAFANASNWLWIDKNSKRLGGLAMPWSYSVNTSLFYIHQYQKKQKRNPVTRCCNKRQSKISRCSCYWRICKKPEFFIVRLWKKYKSVDFLKHLNVFHFEASSCATYTTAGVKCILEHADTGGVFI